MKKLRSTKARNGTSELPNFVQNIKQSEQSGYRGKPINPISSIGYQVEEVYCFCRNVSYGDMIACDDPSCKYEWFHFPCVGLTKKPEANFGQYWYCDTCLE